MLFLVGLGGAGSKIVELFYKKDGLGSLISRLASRTGEEVHGVAIDTSSTIAQLNAIPLENRVLIGKSLAKGHGTGGDVALGEKILREEHELALAALANAGFKKAREIFIIAGLGGGTGTGGFPVLAEKIREAYKVPVIGVLTLPSKSEGMLYSKNAQKKYPSIRASADGVILLDNNVLTTRGKAVDKAYKSINETIYEFLSAFDVNALVRAVRAKVATIGLMQSRVGEIPLKDLLNQLLRNHAWFPLGSFDSIHVILHGAEGKIYGERFAEEWVRNKYGGELRYSVMRTPGSKYFNVYALIAGITGLEERLAVEAPRKVVSSELENLLKDIKPL